MNNSSVYDLPDGKQIDIGDLKFNMLDKLFAPVFKIK